MNIFQRLGALAGSVLLLLVGLVTVSAVTNTAEARVDRRACVSKAEYNSIKRGMTQAQVRAIFDISGSQIDINRAGYWLGTWVESGYWEGEWVDNGYWDEITGEYVDTSFYDEYAYYVDTSWYDEYHKYVTLTDTIRSYKKCRDFGRGRGRVGINFDNYTSSKSGMRVYAKRASNPWSLLNVVYARSATPGKTLPHAPAKPAKPDFKAPAKPTTK